MLNLLRMDFYRFIRHKPFYISLLAFIFFQGFATFMTFQFAPEIFIEFSDEASYFFNIAKSVPFWGVLYISFFIISFYLGECNCGFQKNYISIKNARRNMIFSKLIITQIYIVLLLICWVGTDMAARSLFTGHGALGDIGLLLQYVGLQYLVFAAYSVMFFFITLLCRNYLIALAASAAFMMNLPGMIFSAVDIIFKTNHFQKLFILNQMQILENPISRANGTTLVLAVAVYAIIFLLLSLRFKKREDLR